MYNAVKRQLEALLRQARLLMPSSQMNSSPELQPVFTKICQLVLDGRVYQELWDEAILSQLTWLFQTKPPAAIFDHQVAALCQQAQEAQSVHNFFFQILNRSASIEMVYEALAIVVPAELSLLHRLT